VPYSSRSLIVWYLWCSPCIANRIRVSKPATFADESYQKRRHERAERVRHPLGGAVLYRGYVDVVLPRKDSKAAPSPVQDNTAEGCQVPLNTQFSVFLDNKVGKMLELLAIFEGEDLRLVALIAIDSADHAVVRMVTSREVQARKLLTN